MNLKIFQLNVWGGKFLDEIIELILRADFDIIQLQELAHGPWLRMHNSERNFERLTEALAQTHRGELAPTWKFSDIPDSYFGNATFYRHEYKLRGKDVIWMHEMPDPVSGVTFYERSISEDPRNALSLALEVERKPLHIINAHMAWGPDPFDEEYKTQRAKPLADHVAGLTTPFVLTGDFNVISSTQPVQMISNHASNLVEKYKVETTLHPAYTKAPKPYAVDYIFTSPEFKVNSFAVIDKPDLSDHYGLSADIELLV